MGEGLGDGRSMAAWSSVAPDTKPPKACGDSLTYLSPMAVALRYDGEASHAKCTLKQHQSKPHSPNGVSITALRGGTKEREERQGTQLTIAT